MPDKYKTFELFLKGIVDSFDYADFSPYNSKDDIINKFKKLIHIDTAFWSRSEIPQCFDVSNYSFYITPKSHDYDKENDQIMVRFIIDKKSFKIDLFKIPTHGSPKLVRDESMSYKDIWLDHEIFYDKILVILKESIIKANDL